MIQVVRTDLPGLWDARLPDQRMLFDLTTNQVAVLATSNGWEIQEADELPATDAVG